MIADIMGNKKFQAVVKELYKDLQRMYKGTVVFLFFLTIDTTLPASDPSRFRKNLFHSCKNDSN